VSASHPPANDRFREYSGELNLLLWAVWNPIGSDLPLSEYERYVPTLWRMLEDDSSIDAIAAELTRICQEAMEIEASTNGSTAETLKRWWSWRFEYPEQLTAEAE